MTNAPTHSGMDWLYKLLEAQAKVGYNTFFFMFQAGQTGAFFEAVKQDPTRAKELRDMLEAFETDISDFAQAATDLANVASNIVANGLRNLEKIEQEAEDLPH